MRSTSTASSAFFLALLVNHTCAGFVHKGYQATSGPCRISDSNVMCSRCAICALESCITTDQSAIFVIPPMIGFILYRERSCYKVGSCVLR